MTLEVNANAQPLWPYHIAGCNLFQTYIPRAIYETRWSCTRAGDGCDTLPPKTEVV